VDPLYEEFGRLVRATREASRISQAELGRRVGLSRTSITNIECGRQHVSLRQFVDIAAALGRHPSALLPEARQQLPRAIRSELKRKGYAADLSGLVEQVWSIAASTLQANVPAANEDGETGERRS
jgi:transcriptional regulator with XRE-family HTH domain